MRIHVLERSQRIERPLDEVFPFYADLGNLERITPPWLGFEVVSERPIRTGVGALIEYRLRLHGLPVRWRTRIELGGRAVALRRARAGADLRPPP